MAGLSHGSSEIDQLLEMIQQFLGHLHQSREYFQNKAMGGDHTNDKIYVNESVHLGKVLGEGKKARE